VGRDAGDRLFRVGVACEDIVERVCLGVEGANCCEESESAGGESEKDVAVVEGEESEGVEGRVGSASLTSIGAAVAGVEGMSSSFFLPAFFDVAPEDSFALTGGGWVILAEKEALHVTMLEGRNRMKGEDID